MPEALCAIFASQESTQGGTQITETAPSIGTSFQIASIIARKIIKPYNDFRKRLNSPKKINKNEATASL